MKFRILGIFLFVCLMVKGWHLVTDGFRLDKIENSFEVRPDLKIEYANEEMANVENILKQKFYYLDKGCQTYVYASRDGKYVLKFVRYHKYHLPFWMQWVPFIDRYANSRLQYRERTKEETLKSYKASYDDLRAETGTIFVQLIPSMDRFITIVNRLGIEKRVSLKEVGFIIQKRAVKLEKVLLGLKNEKEGLKKVVVSFLEMEESIGRKGYYNCDYNCIKNSGYLDGRVVTMDLGSFCPLIFEKESLKDSLRNSTKHFCKFASQNMPEANLIYDEYLDKIH